MRRYIFVFLFIITAFLAIRCKDHPKKSDSDYSKVDSKQKKQPGKIEFSEEIHNFGTLKQGEVVAYSFKFRNVGDSSFHLIKAEPACGCLTVNYSKDEISGSAYSSLEVVFRSDGEWGNLIKTIEVESSAGEKKLLTIGAFVENNNFNIDLNN